MKIKLVTIGKTDDKNLSRLIEGYVKRLNHYIRFDIDIINDPKNVKHLSKSELKMREGALILNKISASDQMFLLDEKGKSYRSIEFAGFLQKKMNAGTKQMVLVIGGPYGFSEEVYQKASGRISLSKMTFSHQMVRLFVVEQLYRAMTILKNEPYHHE